MALNVQMILSENRLIGEKIVTPRLVNQQTLDYDTFCDYLAQGSTVTAADVSAVMKQLEKNIPLILGLNTKIVASPEGLVFRPTVKGSITQSQLRAKLIQRKQDYIDNGDLVAAGKINPERTLETGDLATNDLQACIVIDLPKKWDTRFQQSVTYKRVSKANAVVSEDGNNDDENSGEDSGNTPAPKKTVSLTVSPAGAGTVTGGGQYDSGSSVNISATPASGYHFVKWSDNSTNATRTLNILESDIDLQAIFAADTPGDNENENDNENPGGGIEGGDNTGGEGEGGAPMF